jgi:hypothetical protein
VGRSDTPQCVWLPRSCYGYARIYQKTETRGRFNRVWSFHQNCCVVEHNTSYLLPFHQHSCHTVTLLLASVLLTSRSRTCVWELLLRRPYWRGRLFWGHRLCCSLSTRRWCLLRIDKKLVCAYNTLAEIPGVARIQDKVKEFEWYVCRRVLNSRYTKFGWNRLKS